MNRNTAIERAYKQLGNEATFYDGMITCSTLTGRAVCSLVWAMDKESNARYIDLALSGIPENFSGNLLEVPVGTGVLTIPVYQTLPNAKITCLDYSADMMASAQKRASQMGLTNVCFQQGDVGKLPFESESFNRVLSLNGFHAFPDKDAAYHETFRVLKPGGVFCGCFYVKGENKRTDWFIDHLYTPKGFFTPPYETRSSLQKRLSSLYEQVDLSCVNSIACFVCRKSKT